MKKTISAVLAVLFLTAVGTAYGQSKFEEVMSRGVLSGNIQIDAQIYQKDSAIGAQDVPEKFRSNSYAYLQYTNGRFSMGARFEGYFKPMLGYDDRYDGAGVPYYFARFSGNMIDVTVGNFYEQFGSGMLLRAYQDWNLGLDNSIFGARAVVTPTEGITIKGVVGTQRHFWDKQGLIRGIDADLSFNDFIKPMRDWETRIRIGGSFVSKYQESQNIPVSMEGENDTILVYGLNVPQNVGSAAARMSIESHGFTFSGEYAWKANDPTAENGWIYKPGQALLLNVGYSMRGFGILLSAKSVDNMGFRSSRTEAGNYGMINYMPALTRQHTYSVASFYPYACQPNGEVGFQADIYYKIKRGTALGGKYGTDIKLNASVATALNEKPVDGAALHEPGTKGYKAGLFAVSDSIYFVDANIEIAHKFNKHFKATLMYMYQQYNKEVVEGHGDFIKAHIVVGDFTYMFLKKHALRLEVQYMNTKQDDGDWLMGTLEYTFAPQWFLSVSDLWNVGNTDPAKRLHYYYVSAAYVHDALRIALSYGRIRQGIMCAGGVCRELPASNGLMLTITSTF